MDSDYLRSSTISKGGSKPSMLDAIVSLGRLSYHSEPEQLIRGLIRKQSISDREKIHYYMELHFSTKGEPLRIELKQYAMHDPFETPEKLRYVGIVPASGLQFHVTGHDLRHLCSQVLPALAGKLPEHSTLRRQIDAVLRHHFLFDENNPKDRYRYLLNIDSLDGIEPGFTEKLMSSDLKTQDRPQKIAKAILDVVHREHFVSEDRILLYTVRIDGELIADHPDYIQVVLDDQVSMFAKTNRNVCYITGAEDDVSADLTKFRFKYYITDKVNFSAGISGKFESNFQLSRDAAWHVLLGERFIMNHLRLRIGTFNVYLIPEFLDDMGSVRNARHLIGQAVDTVKRLNALKRAEDLEKNWLEIQQEINEFAAPGIRMLIHFLFYEENKNEMKVYRYVKDVPPSYLVHMEETRRTTLKLYRETAPKYYFHSPSLESLYYMLPLELDLSKNKIKNPQQLLQLYDAVLSGRRIHVRELVRSFMKLLTSLQYGAFGAQHVKRKWKEPADEQEAEQLWCRMNWEQQQFIHWLKCMGSVEGGTDAMSEAIQAIPDRLEKERTYLVQCGFNELQAALFLLGCAINKVADAQDIELKSRPIMRKINFRGMSFVAVQKLATEVFEKGLQYKNTMKAKKFYSKYESYYQEMSRLLGQALQWYQSDSGRNNDARKLDESELVFYIISGYAFANAQKAVSAKVMDDGELVEENELENEGEYEDE